MAKAIGARAMVALANERRLEIVRLVSDRELSAGEIGARFDVSQPATSRNLRLLREAGILRERRVGKRRLYRVDPGAVEPVRQVVAVLRPPTE